LYVNLGELKEKGSFKKFSDSYSPDNIDYFNREVKIPADFAVSLTVYKDSDGFIFTGRLTGKFILECSRCLKEFEQEVDRELNFTIPLEDIDEISRVNISSYIHEVLILAIPIKALCDSDCKGICSQCGADLNQESCDCTQEDLDPRLAKLEQFFDES